MFVYIVYVHASDSHTWHTCQCYHDSGIAHADPARRQLLVRQSYPFATSGAQPTEALRKVAMEEASRVTNSDGTVIRIMKDGTNQVCCCHCCSCCCCGCCY